MGKQSTPSKAVTPPKGRPTRSRSDAGRRRVFGPVTQWIAVVVLIILVFVVAFLLLNGGDFNPNNDTADAAVRPTAALSPTAGT